WPLRVTLGRLLPHARGLGFKPRREGFPSEAKKEWGLSPEAKVRVLHTAQLDVTDVNIGELKSILRNATMGTDYLKMMWRRIDFLRTVLDLGYSFVFTDADIMWFRDPFPMFHKDADFQIACDYFNGDPSDLRNLPNGGFNYVKSNKKTIEFYNFWYNSRVTYPHLHDQDVFNKIKFNPFIKKVGLSIRFLDTAYFGGFCQPSRDLNKVCTMHANCCVGLENKVHDLEIMLGDWRKYT
nr:putative nucleotide-diphospho-sugar transferase, nucleotide-diphospho-sugar transferase [Tanacetum cinerariifolium]